MTPTKPRTFDSIQAAATALKLPRRVIQNAKRAGCDAFQGSRVREAELIAWLSEHPDAIDAASDDPRDEKLREEIRKLRIANDAKEGRLIERAWMAERVQRCAGRYNAARARWEAELPPIIAAAGGDVARVREVFKTKVVDEIAQFLTSLASEFEDAA